ncbi:MAG: Zn-finger nucleic acid-binding protein [Phenylobacterium sp.]|jgi:Zn-finger nucleic acid-binding protein
MDRCPSCKARIQQHNANVANHHPCPRCGTELATLLKIEHQAQALFSDSVSHYQQWAWDNALAQAQLAIELHRLPMYLYWFEFLLAQKQAFGDIQQAQDAYLAESAHEAQEMNHSWLLDDD